MKMSDAAFDLAARGWLVFPVAERDKRPKIPKDQGGQGCHDATTDDAQIATWWARWPEANIGVHCGKRSGVWVLDVDPDHGGDRSLAKLEERFGALPPTLEAATGSGGRHLFWRYPEGRAIRNRTAIRVGADRMPGLDVRSNGGYVLAAPSVHPNGRRYEWANELPIAEAPAWLVDLVDAPVVAAPRGDYSPPPVEAADRERRYCEAALRRACERIAGLSDGRREALIREGYTMGGYVGAGLLDFAATRNALVDAGRASGTSHHVERHVTYALTTGSMSPRRPTLRDEPAVRRPGTAPAAVDERGEPVGDLPPMPEDGGAPFDDFAPFYHLTDSGNARRLVAMHGHNLRYCEAWVGSGWLTYDDTRWVVDDTFAVMRLARTVPEAIDEDASRMEAEAEEIGDEDERAELLELAEATRKWARRSESRAGLQSMVELVKSEPGVAVRVSDFDAHPWLLNCPNGTVNLKDGTLMPHRREHMLTAMAGAAYDPEAKCPTWLAFLNRIMGGDQSLVDFLQRAIGYTLVAGTQEQVLFILYGSGANGKSTFVNAIRYAMGDYAKTTTTETFLQKREGGIPNDLAALSNCRMVSANEVADGRRLDEPLVKQLTGGEPINARFLQKEWFSFVPQFTVWMSVNHRPVIRGMDHGIWRRLKMIPFEVTIPAEERDPELGAKLEAEAAGILTWMVEGCLQWREYGLQTPASVQAAADDYRAEMDVVSQFVADVLAPDPDGSIDNSELYNAFRRWCQENGEHEWSHRRLTRELRDRGWAQDRTAVSRYWRGWRIVAASKPTFRGIEGGRRDW